MSSVGSRPTTEGLFFSFIALIVVFGFAEPIGVGLLGDSRTVKAIRVLACCLPFMALSSVFSGYFSAVRRVYKNAGSVILEQAVQIAVTVRLITLVASESVEAACTAVAVGTLVSEIASFLYNLLLCSLDACSLKNKYNDIDPKLIKKLLGISLPIAFSTYIRSGLLTVEHLLIPYGLRKNGASYSSSMSTYGLVQGMVFPIIMFPSCIIYSFAGLLVPELAAYNERKEQAKIDKAVSMVIKYALAFSIGVAGVLVCYSYELSMAFYNSAEAYEYIRLFAPLVTVMYLDGAVDGLLKGLNQQLHSMKINIADALLSVLFVYLLIPSMGVRGYVLTVFICEIFNCGMSLTRLVKISSPSISIKEYVLKPIIGIVLSSSAVVYGFDAFGGTVFDSTANLVFRIALTFALYLLFVFWKDIKRKKNKHPSSSEDGCF